MIQSCKNLVREDNVSSTGFAGAPSCWNQLSTFSTSQQCNKLYDWILVDIKRHSQFEENWASKGASTSARKHKRGRLRGICEHIPWLQREAKCCNSPSQWMILFEVPTPGGQRSFGLRPNRGSFPLLGYTSTLLHMPRLSLPRACFCSNVDAA